MTCITKTSAKSNTRDRPRRQRQLADSDCSITTRSHPHTASAETRHTTLTLMEHAGVPISIISKWAGHYDSAFTQKTYVHASEEDLQRGQAALARIHKIV